MIQGKFSLIAAVSFLVVAAGAITLQNAVAQEQDKIQYNAVYECNPGGLRFRVLSCKGSGNFDRCEVFYINEYSPGGGFKDTNSRGQVIDSINRGCKTKDQPTVKTQRADSGETISASRDSQNAGTQEKEKTQAVACSASSNDSEGETANERIFRGVIRRLWEKEAKAGSDGAVTVTFQKVVVGTPRAWRPSATDAYSQADPKKPIYPVKVTFATCTDYKAAISKRRMERIYDCFVHKAGGWQCTQTGASGALALKDQSEYIQKR